MKMLKIVLLVVALILPNISVGETNEGEIIQARKELSSMGLVYNDKEAFIKSLKSRDKIAIKLFIKADGLDVKRLIRDYGQNSFASAVAKGDIEIVKLMADIFLDDENLLNMGGVICDASRKGQAETLEFLVDRIKALKDDKKRLFLDRYLRIGFVWAARAGKENVVRLLLLKGIDANTIADNATALIYAAKYNHPGIVKILVDSGADKNITDKHAKTALMYAEENGYQEIIKLLKKQ